MIDKETPQCLIDTLKRRRDTHPYTLDLLEGELLFYRKGKGFSIKLEELRAELTVLLSNVKSFIDMISIN